LRMPAPAAADRRTPSISSMREAAHRRGARCSPRAQQPAVRHNLSRRHGNPGRSRPPITASWRGRPRDRQLALHGEADRRARARGEAAFGSSIAASTAPRSILWSCRGPVAKLRERWGSSRKSRSCCTPRALPG
jgi:hypothetical protein